MREEFILRIFKDNKNQGIDIEWMFKILNQKWKTKRRKAVTDTAVPKWKQ